MTGADRPGGTADAPDVLASDRTGRRWPWLAGIVVLVVLVLVGYLLTRGDGAPVAERPTDGGSGAVTPTPGAAGSPMPSEPAPTSAPVDPADVISGKPDVIGPQSPGTALEVAFRIADEYCQRILGWTSSVQRIDGYDLVVVLLQPRPEYPGVLLQFELTWETDRYRWRASRTALEACP